MFFNVLLLKRKHGKISLMVNYLVGNKYIRSQVAMSINQDIHERIKFWNSLQRFAETGSEVVKALSNEYPKRFFLKYRATPPLYF